MYAYCLAAAHHGLRHATLTHYMISNSQMGSGEGWAYVDQMRAGDACRARARADGTGGADDGLLPIRRWWRGPLPVFLHYCQNYRLGEWLFAKRRVPRGLLEDCAHPYLALPPADVHELDHAMQPPGNPCKFPADRKVVPKPARKRDAFALCIGTRVINSAARAARRETCGARDNNTASARLFDLAMKCEKHHR